MCGICGFLDQDSARPVPPRKLKAMVETLAHRGPDGQGMYTGPGVALGHTRLAIIDLNTGDQPMFSADGGLVIVFNGEIYNFRELRRELKTRGYRFKTKSDTEVILNLYQAEGPDAVTRLNGMFAFALWDIKRKRLLLARDRLGIKPLYYALTRSGGLIFGSEVKSLLASGEIEAEVDPVALHDLFTFQNIIGSRSLFKGVRLLEPGTYIVIEDGQTRKEKYWRMEFNENEDLGRDYYREYLRSTFIKAVTGQLVSDVPVGGYLSGGMDTGSIAAVATRYIRPYHTFTCGFDTSQVSPEEAFFDERIEAERLSRTLDTRHHECHLYAGAMENVLTNLIWHLEEPRVGISYQIYYAASLAKREVTVVLSGAGGDEIFGGYPWRYRPVMNIADPRRFAEHYYKAWVRLVPDEHKASFFSSKLNRETEDHSSWDSFQLILSGCNSENPLNRAFYYDINTFLHGLLMVDDKLSMAHSLETRVPFLDNQMLDCALEIPPQYKITDNDFKVILKEAVREILLEETLTRRKQGFTPPDMSWYKANTVEFIKRKLLGPDSRANIYFNPKALQRSHRGASCRRRQPQIPHLDLVVLCGMA